MKKLIGLSLGLCLLPVGSGVVLAQENTSGVEGPPHVLVIQREFLKPGRDGSLHEKSEAAFVRAMAVAKSTTHYFAMASMSGEPRALFFMGFDSFAQWEKENMAVAHDASLSAALDRAGIADGDLLTSEGQSVWEYDPEYSQRADGTISGMRYMELTVYKVRPGHRKEWTELVKLYKDGMADNANAHWAVFESEYGPDNDEYLVATAIKSLAEIDQADMDSKKFESTLGADGMKKLAELSAACVESSRSSLFRFSPKMSYAPTAWVKEDPDFWKPKAEAPAKKEAAKPQQ